MIKYYAIYDNSLEMANPPFIASDDKSAIRMVRNMLLSATDDVFNRVAPVCDIRYAGTFSENQCIFIPEDNPRVVVSLRDIPIPNVDGGNE